MEETKSQLLLLPSSLTVKIPIDSIVGSLLKKRIVVLKVLSNCENSLCLQVKCNPSPFAAWGDGQTEEFFLKLYYYADFTALNQELELYKQLTERSFNSWAAKFVKPYSTVPERIKILGRQHFYVLYRYYEETLQSSASKLVLTTTNAMRVLLSLTRSLMFIHNAGRAHQELSTRSVFINADGEALVRGIGSTAPIQTRCVHKSKAPEFLLHFQAPEFRNISRRIEMN